MLRRHLAYARKRKSGLPVNWMLRPKGAVLIERSDAVRRLNILRTRFLGSVSYETKDRVLSRPIVPRWQGIALGLTLGYADPGREDSDRACRNKCTTTDLVYWISHGTTIDV